jgi:hypothetical protein
MGWVYGVQVPTVSRIAQPGVTNMQSGKVILYFE